MKKRVFGFIFYNRDIGKDELSFIKICNKKNIEPVLFNLSKEFEEDEIENLAKKCDIVFNNSAEEFAIEFVKTLEELGVKVIDSSSTYYYNEDKWVTYLKCFENHIPTIKTILLSENLIAAEKELKKFNEWPVILKRIEGCCGEYVEKANDIKEARKTIEKFNKKGSQKIPIIAQEFMPSFSYRVTLIDGKVVQTAIKKNHSWKSTGVYENRFEKFKVDEPLKEILKKVVKVMKIKVCGVDLLKKDGKWYVLEVNAVPGLDFFEDERDYLIEKIVNLLVKTVNQKVIK